MDVSLSLYKSKPIKDMKKLAFFLIAFIVLSIHFSLADDGGSTPETTISLDLRDLTDSMPKRNRMPPLNRSIVIHYSKGVIRFDCAPQDNYLVKVTHNFTLKEWCSEINFAHPTIRIEEIPGTYTIEARNLANQCFVGQLTL